MIGLERPRDFQSMNLFFAGSTFQFGTRRISTLGLTPFDSSVVYLFEKVHNLLCLSGSLSARVLSNENGAVGARVSEFTLIHIKKQKFC